MGSGAQNIVYHVKGADSNERPSTASLHFVLNCKVHCEVMYD